MCGIAGKHTPGSTENTYSKVISSYTASVKALSYSQNLSERVKQQMTDDDPLLIATMPTTPKGPTDENPPNKLKGVKNEQREIEKAAQDCISTVVLEHPSIHQVIKKLKESRFAHFACHGVSDGSDPSNSGLILQKNGSLPGEAAEQDGLTVSQISDLQLRHAQIAYLSACSTAENRATWLSDEGSTW